METLIREDYQDKTWYINNKGRIFFLDKDKSVHIGSKNGVMSRHLEWWCLFEENGFDKPDEWRFAEKSEVENAGLNYHKPYTPTMRELILKYLDADECFDFNPFEDSMALVNYQRILRDNYKIFITIAEELTHVSIVKYKKSGDVVFISNGTIDADFDLFRDMKRYRKVYYEVLREGVEEALEYLHENKSKSKQ